MTAYRKTPFKRHIRSSLPPLILLFAGLMSLLVGARTALAFGPGDPGDEPGEPEVTPTPLISPRQEQPYLPPNPTMADLGHQKWWMVCMACHGDVGQGLTDEWRATAFGEDQFCWASKCHANNHPPEGFIFPRIVPPAYGPGTLKRFVTADELYLYLFEKMPWWNPASLTEEEAWNLTAWVLQGNGVLPSGDVEIAKASLTPVHMPVQEAPPQPYWPYALVGMLTLAAVGSLSLRSLQLQRQEAAAPRSNPPADEDTKNSP
jgi:hypothetical protein